MRQVAYGIYPWAKSLGVRMSRLSILERVRQPGLLRGISTVLTLGVYGLTNSHESTQEILVLVTVTTLR